MNRPIALIVASLFSILAVATASSAARDRDTRSVEAPDGKIIHYTYARPDDFKPDKTYPTILALPPGPQDAQMVQVMLSYFDPAIRAAGWVVICPVALDGTLFHTGSEQYIPTILADVEKWLLPEGNKYHLAGASNGGVAAFRVATLYPDRFKSITVFPGSLRKEDRGKLAALKGVPVRLYVGADDTVEWTDAAKHAEAECKRAGLDAAVITLPAEGHVIKSIRGDTLLKAMDAFRDKSGHTLNRDQMDVAAVLNDFHDAAAKAEEARYFGLFAPEGVFIGTDAEERWTVAQFREYAHPHFAKGKGWTYRPRPAARNIDLSPDKSLAWFDEILDNDKYGVCRGTGVLRKIEGKWKVSQYHLTVPVPNELMEKVVAQIKANEKKATKGK